MNRLSKAGVTILICSVTGCGYSADRTAVARKANSRNDRIRTVALDVFESKEFRRGLELQLTEALAKRLEGETPYKLTDKKRADTLLTGEIKEVRQSTIGRDFKAVRPRETTATLLVSFQWKDLRTGEILVDRPNFVQTVDYIRPLGEDFYHASQRAMDRLAERILEEMESENW
jgi:Lipopolysaccharide-assembly